MRLLHLTLVLFCQLLLASFLIYSSPVSGSPLSQPQQQAQPQEEKPKQLVEPKSIQAQQVAEPQRVQPQQQPQQPQQLLQNQPQPVVVVVEPQVQAKKAQESVFVAPKLADVVAKPEPIADVQGKSALADKPVESAMKDTKVDLAPKSAADVVVVPEQKLEPKSEPVAKPVVVAKVEPKHSEPVLVEPVVSVAAAALPEVHFSQVVAEPVAEAKPAVAFASATVVAEAPAQVPVAAALVAAAPVAAPEPVLYVTKDSSKVSKHSVEKPVESKPAPLVAKNDIPAAVSVQSPVANPVPVAAPVSVVVPVGVQKVEPAPVVVVQAAPVPTSSVVPVASPITSKPAVVKGGLGPLHLLAATLCSYQPERPVLDDQLTHLYAQRAALRKNLFEFMSLKFTNLEKLSSRLNSGLALEVMPPKAFDPKQGQVKPTHGWPVVGKCTAHDLKLMAEAAWCEVSPVEAAAVKPSRVEPVQALAVAPVVAPSSQQVAREGRFVGELPLPELYSQLLSPAEQQALDQLNLTKQQLASLQSNVNARECKRNSLKLTKALLNHLAEDQTEPSDSWPQLYSQLTTDDCALKRMVDIVSALSTFRTDSTSIVRRDNVEFAFAMDDLRSKVLDGELNSPLTFDKQFIEVEQFLQQSVQLMLANIDPERAKLAQIRYRSLMPSPVVGSSPLASSDDQCVQLHQLLLAKTHPMDCNPNQFGQLPDVLRMAADSLALWSIESELARIAAKSSTSPTEPISPVSPLVASQSRPEVNQCIANLVSG